MSAKFDGTCEVEVCSVRKDGYGLCSMKATKISAYGGRYCDVHASVADVDLESEEGQQRLLKRREMRDE